MRGVHLSSGNQTILENLWEPCPAGDRRSEGWNWAPQTTAIHRMEGGIEGIQEVQQDAVRSVRKRSEGRRGDMGRVGTG